jgi:CDP-diacylglycerol---glycerol-3-phosphate 3-phosphatidyltransferase
MIESLKPFYARILTPAAKCCAALKLHPNTLTAMGIIVSAVAAWFIAKGSWLVAALCIVAGACLDGLDGLLARLTEKKTRFGAIFDSSSDRITEILWFMGLLIFYCTRQPIDRWPIYFTFLALSGAMMVSYVRARCEGVNVPCKEGLLQRPERILILIACLLAGRKIMTWGLLALACAAFATVVQRLIIANKACANNIESIVNARE